VLDWKKSCKLDGMEERVAGWFERQADRHPACIQLGHNPEKKTTSRDRSETT